MANNNNRKNLNVPNLRFPEFEGEWEEGRIGESCNILMCKRIFAFQTSDKGDIPFYKIGTIGSIPNAYISKELYDEYKKNYNYPQKGELLITCAGTVGKCIPFDGKDAYFQDSNIVWISNPTSQINNNFLYYYISQVNWSKLNSTTITRIYNDDLRNLKVIYPSQKEQEKIATLLSLLDRRIEAQNKIIDKYESLIKGLSESLFSHKLRFKKFEQSWEMKSGNEIFKNISDKNHYSNFPILAITQEYGAIPRNLIDYNIAVMDKSIENYKVVQIGDFIISLRSFQGGIEYSPYKGICSPAYIVLRPIIPINRTFYKHYLKTSDYITELNKNIEGIRDGKMISYKQFSEIPLPYPAIAEQNKIANVLSVVEAKLKQEKILLKKYSEQKKFFLQNMLI